MRRFLLRFVTRLALRAPILMLSACALLTVVAGVKARDLFPVETDILALLPTTAPEALTYRRSLLQFGSFDYLVVVVESPIRDRQKTLIEIASRFANVIRDYPKDIQSVEYAPPSTETTVRPTGLPDIGERFIPALLTHSQRKQLDVLLHPKLEQRFGCLRQQLTLPLSAARREKLLKDPLRLGQIIHPDPTHSWGPIRGPNEGGLIISEDGRMLLMVVKPSRPATDLLFSEQLMHWLRAVARYAVESSGPDASLCEIGFIGSHAEAENDALVVRRDLAATLIAAFILVVLLFIVAVRRIGAIFFVSVPLAAGIVWTLGAARLFFDRISVVTCVFGAALVGLGVSQAIHLYNRYLEERTEGAQVANALETALCETGQGVMVGALTTAVGFYGMYFTWFEGFQELAVVGGTGILCCLAAMLLVLPPLVVLSERAPARLKIHVPPSTLGLGRLAATVQTYPRLTLLVGLIVTAWLGFFAERIDFDEDVRHLRAASPEYEDLARRLELRHFELPATQMIAIVSAPTSETALYRNDLLYQRLEDGRTTYSLLGYDSLRTVLPSTRTQRQSQARLRELLDLQKIEERLQQITRQDSFVTTIAAGLFDQLKRWKAAATEENLVHFGGESNPALVQLVSQYVYSRKGRCRVVTHIYPRQGVGNGRPRSDFVAYLGPTDDSLELTGLTVVTDALKQLLRTGMKWAVVLIALTVFLLLILHFRSIRKATVATVPILCSVLWTLGTMQLLGMKLNYLNVIVIPLILGLGIDNGVHILQRYYEGGRRDLESAVEQSGRAVVVTSLATILAFATISFANFQGVREIGIVAMMGVSFALVASILFVPALLRLAGERLRLIDLLGEEENERLPRS